MPRTDEASTTDFSYFFVVVDDSRRDVLKYSGLILLARKPVSFVL
jgi:hypothetical protein